MKSYLKILVTLLIVSLYSCEDILEDDISDDSISITYPLDNMIIEGNTVVFQWLELDGADSYRLQVYKDSYISMDTTISENSFITQLNAGVYKWRVKGTNFAYETDYSFPVEFVMEDSEDLTNQQVNLLSPGNNLYTNNTSLFFTWDDIVTADSYTFELSKGNNSQETIYFEENIQETQISVSENLFSDDAQYIWKVKAVNGVSESEYSERNFYIDRVVPNQTQLVSPLNEAEFSDSEVVFSWDSGSDVGDVMSPLSYSFQLSTTSTFTSNLTNVSVSNTSFSYVFTNSGVYYWRVLIHDQAGNVGLQSTINNIVLNID